MGRTRASAAGTSGGDSGGGNSSSNTSNGDGGEERATLAAQVRARMDPAAQEAFVKDLESYLLCSAWYVTM